MEVNKLFEHLSSINHQIEFLKKQKSEAESQLYDLIKDQVSQQLASNEYGCGTANVDLGSYAVKAVVAKDVKYDQDMLAAVCERIKAAGQDPLEYMKIKYDVSENSYKAWPQNVREVFEPARTVKPKKPVITFEKKD